MRNQRRWIRRNRFDSAQAFDVSSVVAGRARTFVDGVSRTIEHLEVRRVLTQIDIQFDYTYDTSGFFSDPSRKALLDLAAQAYERRFTDSLSAINPGGGNTWSAVIDSPSQLDPNNSSRRLSITIDNPVIDANAIRIYVGALPYGSSRLAEGGPGGYNANGSNAWLDLVQARGQRGALSATPNDIGLWGGSISFSSDANWYFGTDGTAVPAGKTDFVSVAEHELGHVLGIGTLQAWSSKVVSAKFTGREAVRVNGGTQASTTSDGGHWATSTMSDSEQALLVPTIPAARRLFVTSLDWAAFQDMGWEQGNRMYRLYNPNANFHFFTTSKDEYTTLIGLGLRDETTGKDGFSVAPDNSEGAVSLFRLYNPNKGSHYYTTNANERTFLLGKGWNAEGTSGNVFTTKVPGTTELFRLYNNDSGVHLFTTDVNTKNGILAAFPGIWVQHDNVGFVFNALSRDSSGAPSSSGATAAPSFAAATPATAASNAVAPLSTDWSFQFDKAAPSLGLLAAPTTIATQVSSTPLADDSASFTQIAVCAALPTFGDESVTTTLDVAASELLDTVFASLAFDELDPF